MLPWIVHLKSPSDERVLFLQPDFSTDNVAQDLEMGKSIYKPHIISIIQKNISDNPRAIVLAICPDEEDMEKYFQLFRDNGAIVGDFSGAMVFLHEINPNLDEMAQIVKKNQGDGLISYVMNEKSDILAREASILLQKNRFISKVETGTEKRLKNKL